jgi:hypothetical protein
MKKIIAVLVLAAMATTTTAGTLVYTPDVAPMILEESGPMGSGSGAWLIPLLLLGLLFLSAQNSGPNNDLNGSISLNSFNGT